MMSGAKLSVALAMSLAVISMPVGATASGVCDTAAASLVEDCEVANLPLTVAQDRDAGTEPETPTETDSKPGRRNIARDVCETPACPDLPQCEGRCD